MKKLILFLLLVSLFVSSCSKHDEPERSDNHTVLLYFPWSGSLTSSWGSLYGEFKQNIRSIEKSIIELGGTGTTRVIIILATSANEGQMSEVVYNNGVCSEKLIKNYTNWSFTDKSNIIAMFNDVASFTSTATYSMLIGSHGMGWLPRESHPARAKAFGGTVPDTQTNIDVLDEAIKASSIKHLVYLCFDDCYMANVETAYQLRNSTDYLIASTSEIMNIGLPYDEVWRYMYTATPDYKKIVEKFHTFYSSYEYPYGAMSAIDCRQLYRAAELMRRLNKRLVDAGVNAKDLQPQALDGFNSHVFYDMKAYTDMALEKIGGDIMLEADFKQLYADMIVAHSCTRNLFSVYLRGGDIFPVESNCGITISDPTRNGEATPYVSSTAWWKASF